MENWVKCYCPRCKSGNWFYLGNIEDVTIDDPDGCICWNCKKSFWLGSDGDFGYDMDDNANMESGIKSPIYKTCLKGMKSVSLSDLPEKLDRILDEFKMVGNNATMQDSYIITDGANPIAIISPYFLLKDVMVKE